MKKVPAATRTVPWTNLAMTSLLQKRMQGHGVSVATVLCGLASEGGRRCAATITIKLLGNLRGEGMQCITTHQGFRDNCLSRYTIESVIILFKQSLRKRWKEEFENKDEPHR
ncbi:uncharacterized protein [Littorina saxatilis]|uniref:uncharacterized protein n=1 Tax=Littorina saxatilis TaxID=31220 RepID=UPI0038B64C2B